ncbi:MAG: hypothetical protein ACLP7J_14295 [Streptosporangiaceae bacterium]|jgi:hypothetical protein
MPANATARGSSRSRAQSPYVIDDLFVTVHRSAAGVAWRWRTELILLTAALAILWRLAVVMTLVWAAFTLAVTAAVVLVVPQSRRFTLRRVWCVLARHRLQKLCWEARLHTRSGRLPLILWTRPTKVGERAWILCRAGICAEDFENSLGEIRSACYARDARVTRNTRWSHLITIDVIRRDTLAARHQVHSPLPRLPRSASDTQASPRRPSWPDRPALPATPGDITPSAS